MSVFTRSFSSGAVVLYRPLSGTGAVPGSDAFSFSLSSLGLTRNYMVVTATSPAAVPVTQWTFGASISSITLANGQGVMLVPYTTSPPPAPLLVRGGGPVSLTAGDTGGTAAAPTPGPLTGSAAQPGLTGSTAGLGYLSTLPTGGLADRPDAGSSGQSWLYVDGPAGTGVIPGQSSAAVVTSTVAGFGTANGSTGRTTHAYDDSGLDGDFGWGILVG